MTLQQVDELLSALDSPRGVAGVDDETLAQAYGTMPVVTWLDPVFGE